MLKRIHTKSFMTEGTGSYLLSAQNLMWVGEQMILLRDFMAAEITT